MPTRIVELESDVLEKLEAARFFPQESLSEVVRRAQFPQKPHTASELLEDFEHRAGHSPLSDEALERLAQAQQAPQRGVSHWVES